MKTSHNPARISAADLPRLTDLAKRRAQALRREAVADFWHSAYRAFHAVCSAASSAARRIASGMKGAKGVGAA
jgi:hypothetical protein